MSSVEESYFSSHLNGLISFPICSARCAVYLISSRVLNFVTCHRNFQGQMSFLSLSLSLSLFQHLSLTYALDKQHTVCIRLIHTNGRFNKIVFLRWSNKMCTIWGIACGLSRYFSFYLFHPAIWLRRIIITGSMILNARRDVLI